MLGLLLFGLIATAPLLTLSPRYLFQSATPVSPPSPSPPPTATFVAVGGGREGGIIS